MKKKILRNENTLLKDSERQFMEIFWSHPEPMTGNELAEYLTGKSWQQSNILRTLSSLVENGFLTVVGHTLIGKHYVRQFTAAVNREEYAVRAALSAGIEKSSLSDVSVRLAESVGGREDLIQSLETIIEALKRET